MFPAPHKSLHGLFDEVPFVDHVVVRHPDDDVTAADEGEVPRAVAQERSLVELSAIRLKDNAVRNNEVHSADLLEPDLRANLEPQLTKPEPAEALEARLAAGINVPEYSRESRGERRDDVPQRRECERPAIECRVDDRERVFVLHVGAQEDLTHDRGHRLDGGREGRPRSGLPVLHASGRVTEPTTGVGGPRDMEFVMFGGPQAPQPRPRHAGETRSE